MSNQPPESKMGTMPINRLLVTVSLPIIVAMLVQAMYNIVDSMFVAQLSEDALTAVSLAFPAQMLMIGFAVGTGVGSNALLSRSLGERNFGAANKTAANSVFLALCSSIVFAVGGLLFARTFYLMQTDIGSIVDGGVSYLTINMVCSFAIFFQIAFERLLQSTGRTFYAMITQITGAVINIILDPIMIFGLFGFPKLGVTGAAIATVTGQIIATLLAIMFNFKKNHDIKLNFKGFRPDGAIIRKIYAVGAPSIVMQTIGSFMNFGINSILITFTPTATAVYGVYFKLQSFIFMPVFGLNNGMVPIIAYNYGARKPERMKKAYIYGTMYAIGIMLLGLAAFWIFPKQLLGIFNASDAMLAIGVPAMRIISLSFAFAGFCICTVTVLQALGHGGLSLVIAIVRQLVVLLPVVYIFSRVYGLHMVWWAYPIAEVFALLLSLLSLFRVYKTSIRPMEAEASRA